MKNRKQKIVIEPKDLKRILREWFYISNVDWKLIQEDIGSVSQGIAKNTTIEDVLRRGSPKIRGIVEQIRNMIINYHFNIEEKPPKKTMLRYFSGGKGLLWLAPQRRTLKIYLRKEKHLQKGPYNDQYQRLKANGWGGYAEFVFREDEYNDDMLVYIRNLVKQAYGYEK